MSRPQYPDRKYKEIVVFDGLPNSNREYSMTFPVIDNVSRVQACEIALMFDDNVTAGALYGLEFSTSEGSLLAESRNNYNGKFVFFPDQAGTQALKFSPSIESTTQIKQAYHGPLKLDKIKFRLARYDSPETPTYPVDVRVYVKFGFCTVGWPSNARVQAFPH
jgi:hypothetical protein